MVTVPSTVTWAGSNQTRLARTTHQPNTPQTPAEDVDDLWRSDFSPPGVTCCAGTDEIYVVASTGNDVNNVNDVYVGGQFSEVGRQPGTRGIARWDGRRWHDLDGGVSPVGIFDAVFDIAISGDDVYVVGNFEKAGNVGVVDAAGIARWNRTTQTWHTVGNGVGPNTGGLNTVAVAGGNVYVGGNFTKIDGVNANGIAVWNGTAWSPLSGGVQNEPPNEGDETVNDILVSGDSVFVGGSFDFAVNPIGVDDIAANNIAVWNLSAQRWSGLGSGMSASVLTLALDGSTLIAGGNFVRAGGTTVNRMAQWDGNAWRGFGSGANGSVRDVLVKDGAVYAVGGFGQMGGVANTNSAAQWDGAQWQTLHTHTLFSQPDEDVINGLAVLPDGRIFVAGDFNDHGSPLVTNMAVYDRGQWRGTGMGFEDGSTAILGADSYAVAVNAEGQVFVGGDFTEIGGRPFNYLAMWDGSAWNQIGGALDGVVNAFLMRGDDLYVGGGFSKVGENLTAVRIAKYNMRTKVWSALGNGLPGGTVFALAFLGDVLYAGGGGFPSLTECCLWKFDGTTWSPFSQKFLTDQFAFPGIRTNVSALASDGPRLFVGGSFLDLQARQTGQKFLTNDFFAYEPADDSVIVFGTGANNGSTRAGVFALAVGNDGGLYVGGRFTSMNGVAALNIARLGAEGWSALGTGALGSDNPTVAAILPVGNDLYVAGRFETAGVEAFNIAKWNTQTQQWSALGCGISRNGQSVSIARVNGLALQPAHLPSPGLYVAGGIARVGCKPSMGFAVFDNTTSIDPPVPPNLNQKFFLPLLLR
jgi:hypothetical protein